MYGQLIRTTGEYLFYAYDKGWTPAQELTPEDSILTAFGQLETSRYLSDDPILDGFDGDVINA